MELWLAWSSAKSINDASHWLSTRGLTEGHHSQSVRVCCLLPGIHMGMKSQIPALQKGVGPRIYSHLVCTPPSNNLPLVRICRSNDLKATLCQRCLINLVMRCSKFGSCAEEKQMLFQHHEDSESGLTQFVAIRNWTRSQCWQVTMVLTVPMSPNSDRLLRAPSSGRKYTKQVSDMNLLGNVRVLTGACWSREPDHLIPCHLHELHLENFLWRGKFSYYKQRNKS